MARRRSRSQINDEIIQVGHAVDAHTNTRLFNHIGKNMSATKLVVGAIMTAYTGIASEAATLSPNESTTATPVQVVDALNGVFGKQTTGRAIHAKGIVLEGSFVASPAARSL